MKRFLTSAALAAALALGIGHFAYAATTAINTGTYTIDEVNTTPDVTTPGTADGTDGEINDGTAPLQGDDRFLLGGDVTLKFDTDTMGATLSDDILGNKDDFDLNTNTLTLDNLSTDTGGNYSIELGGIISGTGSVDINKSAGDGTGAIILSGTNTFEGGLTMSNGVLIVNNDSALGTGDFTFGNDTAGNNVLVLQGDDATGARAITNNIIIDNTGDDSLYNDIEVNDDDVATLSGTISQTDDADGTGELSGIYKYGTGTLILTKDSTSGLPAGMKVFDGEFVISEGTLRLEDNGALALADIIFDMDDNATPADATPKILNLKDGVDIANKILVDATGSDSVANFINVENDEVATLSGEMATDGFETAGVTKTGEGTLNYIGDGIAFFGDFTVAEGTLMLGTEDNNDPASANGRWGGGVVVASGATLDGRNNSVTGGAFVAGDIELQGGSTFNLYGHKGAPGVIENLGINSTAGNIIVANSDTVINFNLTPGAYQDGDKMIVSQAGNWLDGNGYDVANGEAGVANANRALNASGLNGAAGAFLDANYDFADFGVIDPFYTWTAENNPDAMPGYLGNGAYITLNRNANVLMSNMYTMGADFHNYRSIADATSSRMTWNMHRASCLPVGKCAVEELSCKPKCGGLFGGDVKNSVWANYIYRNNDKMQDSAGRNMDFNSHGIQAGLDLYSTKKVQFGIMFGYENQKLDGDFFGSKLEADDYYVGLYGAHAFGCGWDVRGTLGYNRQSFDMARADIFGNRFLTDFDGEGFEATVEVGKRFNLSKCLSLRPSAGFDVYHTDIDAVREGYTNDINIRHAANYDGIDMTRVYARVGADFMLTKNRYDINVGAYYSYQINESASSASTNVTNDFYTGPGNEWDLSYKFGRSILSLNAGASYYLNQARTLSFYAGYNGNIYFDRAGNDPWSHTVTAGFQWKF